MMGWLMNIETSRQLHHHFQNLTEKSPEWMNFGTQFLPCAAMSLGPSFTLAQAVLTIPNSNADCERVFSMIKKNANREQI